jgi:pullulanase/glycogen debranching enzyme
VPILPQIVDSLRYWVEEFHVDGFLFVNGSALVTGPHGQELSRPPVVEAISFDPVLAGTKLIVNTSSPITGVYKVSSSAEQCSPQKCSPKESVQRVIASFFEN